MYSKFHSMVLLSGMSDSFSQHSGVTQGDCLLTYLLAMCINESKVEMKDIPIVCEIGGNVISVL